jgi:multiple antibiotic resistance protein
MEEKFIRDIAILWATIDPISTLLLFSSLTANLSAKERRRIVYRTIIFSGMILIGALILGQIILSIMGISMLAFQVSGGIILFLFSLRLIFGTAEEKPAEATNAKHDISIYPLTVPVTATPGAIVAVIVLTDNHLYPIAVQAGTGLIVLGILGITCILMLLSERILRIIGPHGASLIIRVMGLILAALSVQLIIDAIGSGALRAVEFLSIL